MSKQGAEFYNRMRIKKAIARKRVKAHAVVETTQNAKQSLGLNPAKLRVTCNPTVDMWDEVINGQVWWDRQDWIKVRWSLEHMGRSDCRKVINSLAPKELERAKWRLRQEWLMACGKLKLEDCKDWDYAYVKWMELFLENKDCLGWANCFLSLAYLAGYRKAEYDVCREAIEIAVARRNQCPT
jgi:hypothetical protein